jgi:diguanylate cyclase (GGDEF)-like protein
MQNNKPPSLGCYRLAGVAILLGITIVVVFFGFSILTAMSRLDTLITSVPAGLSDSFAAFRGELLSLLLPWLFMTVLLGVLSWFLLSRMSQLLLSLEEQVEDRTLALSDANTSLSQTNASLASTLSQLETAHGQTRTLQEMGEFLGTAQSTEEMDAFFARVGPRYFGPDSSGAVYFFSRAHSLLETHAVWGTRSQITVIDPDDCLCLRRGRLSTLHPGDMPCAHIGELPAGMSARCVPLSGGGTVWGFLTVQTSSEFPEDVFLSFAENAAMGISNQRLRASLTAQSTQDALTGLYNRRFFDETLEKELRRAQRNTRPLSLLLVDLDHFKDVNDTLGHDAGDSLLCAVATILKSGVRSSEGDIACRFGGDEFVLLLPDSPLVIASERAAQLIHRLDELTIPGAPASFPRPSASIGIACFPDHARQENDLLRLADEALYRAKNGGRNQAAVALPENKE